MKRPASPGASPVLLQFCGVLALLWLAGTAIRIPLLAVPPVIPLIHDDLSMSETQVGALMGMPLAMFAVAAVPGSALIARFGVLVVAIAGLSIAAAAAAARGAAVDVWTLYAATLTMGFGIAIVQPALPTLARLWAPARTWLANTIFTNGMLVGATLSSALTIPYVLPLVGGSWRFSFVAWSLPGLTAALLYATVAPRPRSTETITQPTSVRWWPDWRSPTLWLLGITLGTNNALFFAANAFIPDYLTSVGLHKMIGATLAWLNGAQLLGSFVMLGMTERFQRGSWPFVIFGPGTMLGLLGVVLCDGNWIVFSAAVAGFSAAVTFIVTFGLPAVLAEHGEVHRMASGMFTISYSIAVIVPIICGASWDLTGLPWTSFLPMVLCAAGVTVSGTMLTLRHTHAHAKTPSPSSVNR